MRYHYEPPATTSRLDHVGSYRRTLPVSLERMYENALDWEHLPHLHAGSFAALECLDSGAWGWRASVTSLSGDQSVIELRLDRNARRWITTNLEGPNSGAEIWTHVFVTAPQQLDIVVDFFVPNVAPQAREKVGRAYAGQYEVLYDEDVWMMSERQRQIDLRLDSTQMTGEVRLSVPVAADLPKLVTLSGREFYLNQHLEQWVIYPAACPHQLGPLAGEISVAGEVHCPWHGYRFDVVSGDCTSGSQCRFGQIPRINIVDDHVVLSWS